MTAEPFVPWVLSLLLAASPPERRTTEDVDAARARYREIAVSIVEAALSAEQPVFTGSRPRTRTMALMASVAVTESGLRADVDDGRTRGKAGECTVFQLMPFARGDCERFLADRKLAAAEAHERMRRSARACMRARGREELMLAAYASGSCEEGLDASRAKVSQALRWLRERGVPPLQ